MDMVLVAGTIAGLNNDVGIVGVAPAIDLFSVKVMDSSGSGTYSQLIEGIEWSIQNDMDIISMSLGGTVDSIALHHAIKKAYDNGILVVSAAGNNGKGENNELYPAKYTEVLSVGAVNPTHIRATYSSTGDGIDLVAPGTNILSTTIDGGYGTLSGTSMAVPHVTGAAALLLSKDKKLSVEKIKNLILTTATPLGEKNEYGNGLLNVAKALGVSNNEIKPDFSNPELSEESKSYIRQADSEIIGLIGKLEDYRKRAIAKGKFELAKEIEQKKNDLTSTANKYHRLPENLQSMSKEQLLTKSAIVELNTYYEKNKNGIDELIQNFHGFLAIISKQFEVPDLYVPSETITVKNDSYEPNNSLDMSTSVSLGSSSSSYISYLGDLDYYKFYTGASSGTLNVKLSIPSDKDYDIYVYDASNNVVATGALGTGSNEDLNFSVNSYSYYYVKVYGYAYGYSINYSDTMSYTLQVGNLIPDMQSLSLNSPIDVSLASGQYQAFSFTPSTSGNYKIFTGQYGGYGGSNDTVLEIYSNPNLTSTSLIASNDDSNGNTFSEISPYVYAGTTYYVKLRHYDTSAGSVYARLMVTLPNLPVDTIYENAPVAVDIQVGQNQFKAYKFTPTTTAGYIINTSSYGGNGVSSDTYLYLYSDPQMTNLLTANDDWIATYFSQINYELQAGVTYYIKFAGYNNNSASARLSVTKEYDLIDVMVEMNDNEGYINAGNVARKYGNMAYIGGDTTSISDEIIASNLDYTVTSPDGQLWMNTWRLSHYMPIYYDIYSNVVRIDAGASDIVEEYEENLDVDYDQNIEIVDDASSAYAIIDSENISRIAFVRFSFGTIKSSLRVVNGQIKSTVKPTIVVKGGKINTYNAYHYLESSKDSPTAYGPSYQYWSTFSREDDVNVTYGTTSTKYFTPSTTNFYRVNYTIIVSSGLSVGRGSRNGPQRILLNKLNMEYPKYKDSHSGKVMHFPWRADYNKIPEYQRVLWYSSTERDKYIKEYISLYGDPKRNWSDYDLHHIIQRQFGGDNSFYNLIPLLRDYHQQVVEKWWKYYLMSDTLDDGDH
jgi:hypothetical protein